MLSAKHHLLVLSTSAAATTLHWLLWAYSSHGSLLLRTALRIILLLSWYDRNKFFEAGPLPETNQKRHGWDLTVTACLLLCLGCLSNDVMDFLGLSGSRYMVLSPQAAHFLLCFMALGILEPIRQNVRSLSPCQISSPADTKATAEDRRHSLLLDSRAAKSSLAQMHREPAGGVLLLARRVYQPGSYLDHPRPDILGSRHPLRRLFVFYAAAAGDSAVGCGRYGSLANLLSSRNDVKSRVGS
jgi:hypothetical protein